MALDTSIVYLETRRDEITNILATFTATYGSGPDFTLDGVSINSGQYRAGLIKELQDLQQLIDGWGGPCIVETYVR